MVQEIQFIITTQKPQEQKETGHIAATVKKQIVSRRWNWARKPPGQPPVIHFLQQSSTP